jgi:hypothetical protein
MAHDVFLSHSAQNREVADAVCAALEKAAIRCWVAPRDVRPGRSFPGEITRAIQQSKVMLLIFSSHSNNSEQVLREVQLATDSRLPIIRFRIEDVALTDDLRYFLSTPHWLDALTPPLSKHIERLELAIKELLGQAVEVTGKNVVSEDAPPAVAPIATPTVVPSAVAPAMPPPLPMASPARTEREAVAPKSSNPWPLLAIGAVVIFAAIIGVIVIVMQSKPSSQQTATTPPPSVQTPAAKTRTSPAPPPAKTSKVTQNTTVQPARSPRATPAAEKQHSSEPGNVPAFDRAGALKRPSESKSEPAREPGNEPKSAFDRAGGNIGSDQTKAEPSPDDE